MILHHLDLIPVRPSIVWDELIPLRNCTYLAEAAGKAHHNQVKSEFVKFQFENEQNDSFVIF